MHLRYQLGKLINFSGFTLVSSHRIPKFHINHVEFVYRLLRLSYPDATLTIIQVGAFDGLVSDPIYKLLEMDRKVEAVLIEPQSIPFSHLAEKYKTFDNISLENSALSKEDGLLTLYIPDQSASPQASSNPTHFKRFGFSAKVVKQVSVPAISVNSMLSKYDIKNIDLLQIDTEGTDLEILKYFLAEKKNPKVLNLESYHLGKKDKDELYSILNGNGYSYFDIGFDTCAIQRYLLNSIS